MAHRRVKKFECEEGLSRCGSAPFVATKTKEAGPKCMPSYDIVRILLLKELTNMV